MVEASAKPLEIGELENLSEPELESIIAS